MRPRVLGRLAEWRLLEAVSENPLRVTGDVGGDLTAGAVETAADVENAATDGRQGNDVAADAIGRATAEAGPGMGGGIETRDRVRRRTAGLSEAAAHIHRVAGDGEGVHCAVHPIGCAVTKWARKVDRSSVCGG